MSQSQVADALVVETLDVGKIVLDSHAVFNSKESCDFAGVDNLFGLGGGAADLDVVGVFRNLLVQAVDHRVGHGESSALREGDTNATGEGLEIDAAGLEARDVDVIMVIEPGNVITAFHLQDGIAVQVGHESFHVQFIRIVNHIISLSHT